MKVKPGSGISLLLLKTPREPPRLTSPFDGRIAINSTYAFASYPLMRDLELDTGIFGTETSDWGSASPAVPVAVPRRK